MTALKPGCLIIDISCDEGMGFSFFPNPPHLGIRCLGLDRLIITPWITHRAICGKVPRDRSLAPSLSTCQRLWQVVMHGNKMRPFDAQWILRQE